ncbi:MAG TPA: hypothetical protein VGM82_19390 [Gemmatimonadaceae bacterium]
MRAKHYVDLINSLAVLVAEDSEKIVDTTEYPFSNCVNVEEGPVATVQAIEPTFVGRLTRVSHLNTRSAADSDPEQYLTPAPDKIAT